MTEPDAITRIKGAAKRRKRADTARRKATDDLRDFCRQARAEGLPITRIAEAAELSRQGVYDLLAQRPC